MQAHFFFWAWKSNQRMCIVSFAFFFSVFNSASACVLEFSVRVFQFQSIPLFLFYYYSQRLGSFLFFSSSMMVASFFAETRRSLLHRHLYLCFYLLRLCEPQLSIELFYLLPLSFFLLFFLVFVIVAVLDLHLCKYLARRRCGSLDLNMYLLFFFFSVSVLYTG